MLDCEREYSYDCCDCEKLEKKFEGVADCFEALQKMLYESETIDNDEVHNLCDEIASYLKVKNRLERPRLRRDVPEYLKGFLMDYVGGHG
jgi:hypothetical protein